MKRTIRYGCFETNSSSMHSLVITKEVPTEFLEELIKDGYSYKDYEYRGVIRIGADEEVRNLTEEIEEKRYNPRWAPSTYDFPLRNYYRGFYVLATPLEKALFILGGLDADPGDTNYMRVMNALHKVYPDLEMIVPHYETEVNIYYSSEYNPRLAKENTIDGKKKDSFYGYIVEDHDSFQVKYYRSFSSADDEVEFLSTKIAEYTPENISDYKSECENFDFLEEVIVNPHYLIVCDSDETDYFWGDYIRTGKFDVNNIKEVWENPDKYKLWKATTFQEYTKVEYEIENENN